MRKMKETGLSWLNQIPEDWQISKIKYVSTLSPICDRSELTPESVITYTPMEYIKNGAFINNTEQYGKVPASLTPYQEGDIAMAKVTPCFENGNIAVMEELSNGFGLGSSELIIFRPESIETRYLFYWLRNAAFVERAISTITGTGGLKRISTEFVKNSEIPIPNVDEQRKIAEYLDKKCFQLDSIIDRQHQLIEKLNTYKLSVITDAVTKGINKDIPLKDSGIEWIGDIPEHWMIGKVKYGVSKVGSGKTPKGGANVYSDSGVLFIRSQNVYNDGLMLANATYISEEIDEEMSNTRVYGNDVLLNITGGSIGRSCIYPADLPHANVNQHVCIIRTIPDIFTSEYMHYFWISHCGKTSIDIFQSGANRGGMNFEQINNTAIPYVPLEEQKQIADFLDKKCAAIDDSIAKRQQLIEKLTEYKKSLIYEVVTGKKEV